MCLEKAIKGQHHHNSHRHGLGVRLKTNPTIPPLPEEGGDDRAEPEDPSTELLRRVLAGSREPDVGERDQPRV